MGIIPLLFHIIPKLVQAIFINYNEIYQTLAAEDVLIPKPFLDLDFGCVVRWKSQASEFFFSFPNT
jgi:hypothetical protein